MAENKMKNWGSKYLNSHFYVWGLGLRQPVTRNPVTSERG